MRQGFVRHRERLWHRCPVARPALPRNWKSADWRSHSDGCQRWPVQRNKTREEQEQHEQHKSKNNIKHRKNKKNKNNTSNTRARTTASTGRNNTSITRNTSITSTRQCNSRMFPGTARSLCTCKPSRVDQHALLEWLQKQCNHREEDEEDEEDEEEEDEEEEETEDEDEDGGRGG